jgi:hypothetical protein
MRLVELFLIETTEEDRAIISLANVIYRHVGKYMDYIDPESTKPVPIGKICDFADTPLDGFEDIEIELQQGEALSRHVAELHKEEYSGRKIGGVWINGEPKIILNADNIGSDRIKSIIVHELRHALDDLKSEGKASSSTRYSTPKKKEHRKNDPYSGKNYPYLAKPEEINARFAQVLDGLVDSISKNSNMRPDQLWDQEIKVLKRLLSAYDISSLFPEREKSRDYKRLIKRAVDFIQKEIKYIQSV